MRIITLGLSACLTACGGHVGHTIESETRLLVLERPPSLLDTPLTGVIERSPAVSRLSPAANQHPQVRASGLAETPLQAKTPSPVQIEESRRMEVVQGQGAETATTWLSTDNYKLPLPADDKTEKNKARAKASDHENPGAEVSYGQKDESLFVRSSYSSGDFFTVGTAFTQRKSEDEAEELSDDSQGFWHMKMSSDALGAATRMQAEFAQSSFDPYTSEGFGSAENRLIKLATKSSWQGFQGGVGYQSVGKKFANEEKTLNGRKKNDNNPQNKLLKDQRGTEAWVSRQFGKLGVKTLASVYQNNLEGDDKVPRFTTRKVGGSLNYMISAWPSAGITLDYRNGVRGSSDEPNGLQSMQVDVENIASSLYYSDNSWSSTLYVENATGEGTTNIANLRTYWLGGSYFPSSTFSVTPSVSYVKEDYPEFDVSTDSFATSMTVSYKPSKNSRFDFTGYSEYSTEENRDWSMDSEYMYNSLGVNWDSKKPKSFIKKWSLELFHDQYTDNLYSTNNTGGLGFMMKLRSATSPFRRISEEVR